MNFAAAFTFLQKLSKNNNRDWFEKNKETWLEIKSDFETFIADVYNAMCEFDPVLAGQDPRKLVFRIYRDIRFSRDKRPYKDYLSAGISTQGKGTGVPGYYLQFGPGNNSFICAGLYAPSSETLAGIRQEIDYNGEILEGILKKKDLKKYYGNFWQGDSLKTAPKGYAKDHPHIEWLRLRHFVLMHPIADEAVKDKKFASRVVPVMKAAKPFNDFLKHAQD